ncbi:hypothetical protein [Chryseobacterium potabilaquae]|uniref:Lipocalin-like domain-containing protein n=1 Tax=Chryseobacterium potabilaquae TaxID=2675057 RepID=A0A6N4XAN7_9FLAO|nr:hypothetical protein [Chryseobacterium potabilaquae]CAA7195483.1 hypothetical protein CHRY9293_01681 [Chryseobacterium potabilaquae]
MRKYYFIFVCLILSTILLNCSSSGDNDSIENVVTEQLSIQSRLIGKWYTDSNEPDIVYFRSDGRVEMTYLKFGNNNEDIIDMGT